MSFDPRRHQRLPRILLDCGTEDSLLACNREFHRELKELNVPHVYREFPGFHDWDYWDLHVREALEFHFGGMRVVGEPIPEPTSDAVKVQVRSA